MPDRLLVTGFLRFANVEVNPSALLAESCGRPHALLEVAYDAVDDFVERVAADEAPTLLMMGVDARATTMKLERVARNQTGLTPDVRGVVRGPGPIDPHGPGAIRTTLFNTLPDAAFEPFSLSDDAGCYLCNYACYRALRRLPGKRVGFLHVPPLDLMPLAAQQRALARLLERLERGG